MGAAGNPVAKLLRRFAAGEYKVSLTQKPGAPAAASAATAATAAAAAAATVAVLALVFVGWLSGWLTKTGCPSPLQKFKKPTREKVEVRDVELSSAE